MSRAFSDNFGHVCVCVCWTAGEYDIDTQDPHVVACLLKLWFRELPEPVIPEDK